MMRTLELLAPAKNLECGKAAIDHGADAVYIGAPRFGARASAGNSIADIRELCQYAHQFEAKVYVTVNTIIYDAELEATRQLLEELSTAGIDAILVQDMSLLSLCASLASPIALHASTQTDNRTAEKVAWLHSLGFRRVVLARELSVAEIADIHRQQPDVELEVFVHGALCVSYSGLCYASQYCFKRSANRGECAQFCRMKFDLLDADGRVLEQQRHLLSLKDMNQLANLEQLAEAGACSFKIEGRLKDIAYVKNVTAAYSEQLNQLIRRYPDKYCRASRGNVTCTFRPDLAKTFNRGYTSYFAPGRQPDIASFDTPKALGEYVGIVKELRGRVSFNVAGTASFANGDGLCFFNDNHELVGFRVNKVENNRLYPLSMPTALRPGTRLYRNNDQEFERLLSKPSAERKIPVSMSLTVTPTGFALAMDNVSIQVEAEHQQADKPQHDNIVRQLSKLGGTPFSCNRVEVPADFSYFIPSSQLADMRRRVVSEYLRVHSQSVKLEVSKASAKSVPAYAQPYFYNMANQVACDFYQHQGVKPAAAFELTQPQKAVIMQCRHCIRYALGFCVKHGGSRPTWHEPLYLQLGDGRRFQLEFDCKQCQMNVTAVTACGLNDK